MIVMLCPFCKSVIIIPGHLKGASSSCPNCRRSLTVPSQPLSEDDQQQLRRAIKRLKGEPASDRDGASDTDVGMA
jgi:hypothetical protein